MLWICLRLPGHIMIVIKYKPDVLFCFVLLFTKDWSSLYVMISVMVSPPPPSSGNNAMKRPSDCVLVFKCVCVCVCVCFGGSQVFYNDDAGPLYKFSLEKDFFLNRMLVWLLWVAVEQWPRMKTVGWLSQFDVICRCLSWCRSEPQGSTCRGLRQQYLWFLPVFLPFIRFLYRTCASTVPSCLYYVLACQL